MAKQQDTWSQKQDLSPISPVTYHNELISDKEKDAFGFSEHLQPITHLLSLGQVLCNQSGGIIYNLCKEVTKVTQHKAKLVVDKRKREDQKEISKSPFCFPVYFGDRKYGVLLICPDPLRCDSPAISFATSLLLAQICGTLLHIAEQSIIFQLNNQNFCKKGNLDLTNREREILVLICRGYNAEKISSQLFISPKTVKRHKHNIYIKLDVHSEHELLLAAYFANLFLPLEDL